MSLNISRRLEKVLTLVMAWRFLGLEEPFLRCPCWWWKPHLRGKPLGAKNASSTQVPILILGQNKWNGPLYNFFSRITQITTFFNRSPNTSIPPQIFLKNSIYFVNNRQLNINVFNFLNIHNSWTNKDNWVIFLLIKLKTLYFLFQLLRILWKFNFL